MSNKKCWAAQTLEYQASTSQRASIKPDVTFKIDFSFCFSPNTVSFKMANKKKPSWSSHGPSEQADQHGSHQLKEKEMAFKQWRG